MSIATSLRRRLQPRITCAVLIVGSLVLPGGTAAQSARGASPASWQAEIERRAADVLPKVVAWRRDIHQHPELSGEEVRTARLVAEQLRALGLEVRTGVGGHGVVGLLRGARPGKVIALRADMDGLPVEELVDLPFKSTQKGTYRGQTVGIMHACGHDNHVAMLLGAAEVLVGLKDRLAGSVKFIFQPAEEGLPNGGTGAVEMIRDGVLANPTVDAIVGLHVSNRPLGEISYRPGPAMAASNSFTITIRGRQAHGAMPWQGVDPIVVGAQVVSTLQTVISRQTDISGVPAIVTVGAFNGGVRGNIIPDSVVMVGTIRTFDLDIRRDVFARVTRTAEAVAMASGATAKVVIDSGNLVTRNDSALTRQLAPALVRAAGAGGVVTAPLWTASEDFSWFQDQVPGLFFNLGITPRDKDPAVTPGNHSPLFFADEAALPVGVKALVMTAVEFLHGGGT